MQDPIEAYCHVGVVHPMAFPEVALGEGPILETLARIAEDPFFSAVEVGWIKDKQVRAEAAALLAASGMDIIFGGQGAQMRAGASLCGLDAAARKQAIALAKQEIDQAYEMGASILALWSGPDPGEAQREAATAALVESLKELCADAQKKASATMLTLTLESFDRTVDKKALIGPTREAAAVAEAVYAECSNFGLTLDLSHQPLLRESVHEMLLAASDRLIHVHVGNCVAADPSHPAYGDTHPRFGLPGGAVGVEELKRFLEALVYIGYFKRSTPTTMPVVSFEVKPQPGESSALVLANAKRIFRQAWARV